MRKMCKGKGALLVILLLGVFLPAFLVSCNGGGGGGESTPAPVAGFSALPTTGPATLAVAFTDSSTGRITDWSWDFGDGGTSTDQNPSHDYTTNGTYTVALTVTGPGGDNTATQVGYINVTPLAQFSGTPTSGDAPLTVTFTNASTGTDGSTTYAWDFGDGGTSALQNPPPYTYTGAGNFTVSLTATGPGGPNTNTKPNYISTSLPPPPVAGFSGTPLTGEAPLTVTFTDESTGVISGWSWDFGDGGTSPDQNPDPYTYTAVGTYTVSLTVTGPGGDNTASITDYIDVVCPPAPLADFLVTETSGPVPLTTSFVDASTGYVTEWLYDFGDGTTSTEQSPANHVYSENGIYSPSLTVTGPCASDTNEHTGQIEVTPNAEFLIDTDTGPAPLTVTFIDNTTGINLATWEWDFGDGGTSPDQNPLPYTYTDNGVYSPSLTVTDVDGLSSTVTHPGQIVVGTP